MWSFEGRSDVEEIVEDAVTQIKDIIYSDVNTYIEDYKTRYESSQKLVTALREKITSLEKEVASSVNKIESLESALKKEDVTATFPFSIDERVYFIVGRSDFEIECRVCGGTRKITRVIDGTVYSADCPACSYSVPDDKRTSSKETTYKYSVESGVVVRIEAIFTQENAPTYKYTIKTCIGSHYTYKDTDLYKSSDDARNAAINKERATKAIAYYKTNHEVPDILKDYLPEEYKQDDCKKD